MRLPRRARRSIALAVAAAIAACAVLAMVAFMRSGSSAPATAPAAQAQSRDQNLKLVWHDFAECLRTHGYPQIADPTFLANGDLDFGNQGLALKTATRALGRTACRTQFAAVKGPAAEPPPTAAELHRMVLFSRCMRQHGIPDWPDPRADGTYPLNLRLAQAGKRAIISQLVACRGIDPGGRIRATSPAAPKKT